MNAIQLLTAIRDSNIDERYFSCCGNSLDVADDLKKVSLEPKIHLTLSQNEQLRTSVKLSFHID